jgi:phosphatidate cytidylyltransferase
LASDLPDEERCPAPGGRLAATVNTIDRDRSFGLPRDLGPRIASGLVLAVAAVLLTWTGVGSFALLAAGIGLIVAWEWGRIVRKAGMDAIFIVHAAAVVGASALTLAGMPALGILMLLVGALTVVFLGFGRFGRMSALGVLYAGLPAVILIWIRGSEPYGFAAVMFLMATVWAADTSAYFAGRNLGGPKLIPLVSPNKTWSGFLGGLAVSVLLAVGFAAAIAGASTSRLVLAAIFFAIVAQAGDLMESALKRWHGVKDASSLIPGHGGFMDRVDGLIFVAFAAGLIAAATNIHNPGAGLLMWR